MNSNCIYDLRSVRHICVFLVFSLLFSNFVYLNAQSPQEKVTSYLKSTSAYYGLKSGDISDFEITSHHVSSVSGIQHIYFTQRYTGIGIFTTESSAHFKNNGNLFTANNLFIPDLKESVEGDGTPDLSAIQAIEKVSAELGYQQLGNLFVMQYQGGKEQKSIISKGQISIEDIPVKLKYFPFRTRSTVSNSTQKDRLVLAWEMYIYEPNQLNYWHILADATTGKILFKNNLVLNCGFGESHSADNCTGHLHEEKINKYSVPAFPTPAMVGGYRVYAMPIESPGHGGRTLVLNPDNPLASPFGWHDTNGASGAEYTITRGNNTHTYEDGNNSGYSPDGGAGLTFDFPINTVYTMGVDESEPAAITNLFYWTNIIHDVIYQYGFTEAAGNFQVNNYGRGGTGNDDVMAEAQDGSGTCNANFATPIEGNRPRMQMYVCGNRDGDLDNAVIIHEYGHGISIRLTGGPFNSSCLNNQEQPGEGWSDWYGLMLTMKAGDAGPNSRGIGTWLFGQPPTGPGIRQYPYSTNLGINPHTYDNIKTAAVPHGVGSVWCAMLWEVTWDLIAQYGFDPNFYTGNGGNNRALKLVTEALKIQPCSPGFVDARNAILKADTVLYNAQNACLIWKAFAKRGLGYSALQGSSASRSDGTQAFDIPPACMAQAPQTVCFDYTGGMQTWVVPAGVTSVTIEANGAEGATAPSSISVCGGSPDRGGRGGLATGTLAVTPGETLNIFVGQKGFNGPGNAFNGGGSGCNDPSTCSGGGGASDVRKGGSGLANRVIVAGGGGGAEFSCGNQGGGAGGGLAGANGLGGDCSAGDATGGTQVGGGIGGNGPACGWPSGGGQNGTLGQGGNSSLVGGSSLHSGAGGGGYYGGGAGSVDGHGGGGSSYIGGVTGGSTTPGVNLGNGRVCITFGAANGTGPSITCPTNATVGCAVDIPPVNIGAPRVANGTCQGTLVVTHRKDSITDQTCPNRYNVHRIYRVTDPCGNFAECIQLIIVNDITAPSVVCPAPVNVQCASAVPPVNINSVITADHCGNVGLVVTHVGDVITNRTCVNRFTITRTYRSTDACGNSGTCSQVITVFDNTVPLVVCRNITVNLDEAGNAIITPSQITQSVSDNCTPNALLVVTASRTSFTCANIGPNNVTLSTTDECGNVGTCLAVVTVVDNLPPMIMGCPTKSPITINLGPGECEASWDAPPFMAMDNCPAGAYFGNRNTTTVCLPPASYWSITGGAASWGVMFDLINTSGSLLNLQLLGERAFANVPHNIYYTTNPGGHAPVVATPNAWTLCATRTPQFGAQFTTRIDSFGLLTGSRTDTLKRCAPIQTETTVLGCLTMAPGETRGIYIHAPGTGGTNASLFSGCAGRPMGDANIRTPIDGATYTGGQFAAPFINSSFGFGGANWMGVIGYNLANSNRVPLVQTCGAPYGPGCFFPIGCTKLCYRATDASGNVGTCEFEVCVNKYANPTRALACNDDIQISLDDSCRATIYPDMVLEGGPYSCYDDYIVEVRDWKGRTIDRP
ncbi:MAG: M36 family metallopeptidase [Saprospiraceae bacterium]|nr:M36 family metallopeptidase [Candidatus Vicinibacter proximus]